MNTSMTHDDSRVYDNGEIRMSHYDSRIRRQVILECAYAWRIRITRILPTFAILLVNIIANTATLVIRTSNYARALYSSRFSHYSI